MKIKIIKDCENGLKVGDLRTLNTSVAKELIRLGIAEEVKATRKATPKKEK